MKTIREMAEEYAAGHYLPTRAPIHHAEAVEHYLAGAKAALEVAGTCADRGLAIIENMQPAEHTTQLVWRQAAGTASREIGKLIRTLTPE